MPLENNVDNEPESIKNFKVTLSKLETIEGRNAGLSFVPGENDLIIATTAKSGTTLCQAIVHSLRTGGDMSYDEISLVIPCIEMAYDYGVKDLSTWPQGDFAPRAFKTHLWYRDCPKWCQGEDQHNRVIFVCRDPLDAAPSFYHFFNGWFFDHNEISMEDFVTHFCLVRPFPPFLSTPLLSHFPFSTIYSNYREEELQKLASKMPVTGTPLPVGTHIETNHGCCGFITKT